ncbi:MAG: hypothetical protein Tsb009_35770 [Planctomycetaceae bacterium]
MASLNLEDYEPTEAGFQQFMEVWSSTMNMSGPDFESFVDSIENPNGLPSDKHDNFSLWREVSETTSAVGETFADGRAFDSVHAAANQMADMMTGGVFDFSDFKPIYGNQEAHDNGVTVGTIWGVANWGAIIWFGYQAAPAGLAYANAYTPWAVSAANSPITWSTAAAGFTGYQTDWDPAAMAFAGFEWYYGAPRPFVTLPAGPRPPRPTPPPQMPDEGWTYTPPVQQGSPGNLGTNPQWKDPRMWGKK